MEGTPNNPPANMPPMRPFWRSEKDWICVIEFLRSDDPEDRARGAESIGYLFGYAQMTDTRMLALVGSKRDEVYELLFSFNSAENKAEFLRLMQSNDATACEEDQIVVPRQEEIEAAQPIASVLPADVMRQVTLVAATLSGGFGPETIQ
ncbi:MAG: hypothetical protein WB439_08945 [Acidobacteriaceae bacterium]